MSFYQSKSNLVGPVVYLTGQDIIRPGEGTQFIQSIDNCGIIILAKDFVPQRNCAFCVQTGKAGLYLLNNSSVSYTGNLFLIPDKMHNLNIVYKDGSWKLYSDSGYLGDNNVVIDWTMFFNSNVTGAPPLAARRYAIFINGIYNSLLQNSSLFNQAVANESANALAASLLPGVNTSSIYSKYPQLSGSDQSTVTTFITTYLAKPSSVIPEAATNPAYTIPPPPLQTKWSGTNPVLPNWNSTNLAYLANTFTSALHDPATTMDPDAVSLQQIVRTPVTNEIAYHFANTPPPAHMIAIACSMLANKDLSAYDQAQILSFVSIGIADAGIFAWTNKYTYWGARPFQYISGYNPLIATPNFPGFISGHSTFSAAWDQLLGMLVPSVRNMATYLANLSGISRLYGGIHFSDDNVSGLSSGRSIGSSVYTALLSKYQTNEPFL